MRERAINLRDWEVRALLAGADVIVRPVVPPPPCAPGDNDDLEILLALGEIKAPYAVGDVLWGRETFMLGERYGTEYGGWPFEDEVYLGPIPKEQPSMANNNFAGTGMWIAYRADNDNGDERWRPSTHMPRWACRIKRAVAKVEPVRLRDIRAAVIERMGFNVAAKLPLIPLPSCFDSVIDAVADKLFSEQWNAVWREYPYAGNPWGWMYEVTA